MSHSICASLAGFHLLPTTAVSGASGMMSHHRNFDEGRCYPEQEMVGKTRKIASPSSACVEVVTFRILAGIFRSLGEFIPEIVRQFIRDFRVKSENLADLILHPGMMEQPPAYLPTACLS